MLCAYGARGAYGEIFQAEMIKAANSAANCVLLQGVLSLKKSFFEPRYILLIPTQVESYISRLNSRGLYTPAQIKAVVSRVELYTSTKRQHPEFFDSVIHTGMLPRTFFTITVNKSMDVG